MDIIKNLFKTFGKCLLIALQYTFILVIAIAPIIISVFIAKYIGYWWLLLLFVSIVWCFAVVIVTGKYTYEHYFE